MDYYYLVKMNTFFDTQDGLVCTCEHQYFEKYKNRGPCAGWQRRRRRRRRSMVLSLLSSLMPSSARSRHETRTPAILAGPPKLASPGKQAETKKHCKSLPSPPPPPPATGPARFQPTYVSYLCATKFGSLFPPALPRRPSSQHISTNKSKRCPERVYLSIPSQ